MSPSVSSAFREITPERVDEFVAAGHKRRHFFPHRVYHLPKCGPDGFKHALAMCRNADPASMRQVLLYAAPPVVEAFPCEFFFDDDLVWHRQQFGLPGQVASANLVLDGTTVHSMGHLSDVVQRISRRREHKTKVSKHFRGWSRMLLNAVLGFAREQGATRVRTPSAELAMWHTDPARRDGLGSELFERIYDGTVADLVPARRDGAWWMIDVAEARERVVMPERRTETLPARKTICVCHDVERGLGHLDVDPGFAAEAQHVSPGHLAEMRRIEAELGVQATYFVVGSLLAEVRDGLEADGHCVAFHSFDHRLDTRQLRRCRGVDYRIKGYRPPRSVITRELSDRRLLFHNFEWLASSPRSLGTAAPRMRAGVVRVPIACDDFAMHEHGLAYERWERDALARIAESDFAAISLHDCYAHRWLAHYRGLLEKLREMGELRTLDEVAAEVTLCSAS